MRSRLGGLTLVDEQRLSRRLAGLRKIRDPQARERSMAAIERAVDEAEVAIERRRSALPAITYPEHLPVSERRDEIAAAIRDHQVVVARRRDRLGQDHAAAEDLPRARPRDPRDGSGTRSRAGSRPGAWPSAWPRSSTARSATPSASRCGSPIKSARTRSSRS